jgi:TIR domain
VIAPDYIDNGPVYFLVLALGSLAALLIRQRALSAVSIGAPTKPRKAARIESVRHLPNQPKSQPQSSNPTIYPPIPTQKTIDTGVLQRPVAIPVPSGFEVKVRLPKPEPVVEAVDPVEAVKQEPPAEIVTIEEPSVPKDPPDEVEFFVARPLKVSNKMPFTAYVKLTKFDSSTIPDKELDQTDPDSLVTAIRPNGLVEIELTSEHLEIDSPLQSLTWRGRDAFAAFIMHPEFLKSSIEVTNVARVLVDGQVKGTIEFDIHVEPGFENSNSEVRIKDKVGHSLPFDQQFGLSLTNEGSKAKVVKRAFICHSHDDGLLITEFCRSLAAAGLDVLVDLRSLQDQTEPWKKPALDLIAQADIAYVMWSRDASKSSSIADELNEIKKRLPKDLTPATNFGVVLVRLDDNNMMPSWLCDLENKSHAPFWRLMRDFYLQKAKNAPQVNS